MIYVVYALLLLFVIMVVMFRADARFQSRTDEQIEELFSKIPGEPSSVVSERALQPLPAPVKRWLRSSGVVGKPIPKTVRLKQRGLLRTDPKKEYMPAEAEQYFRVVEPGFIWRVRVKMMRFLPIAGRDSYVNGRGRMLIKLASIVAVADAADEKIAQGSLIRYLSETVWFPAAVLSAHISWKPLDENSAEATMSYKGVKGSAIFSFDEHGRFVGLRSKRYFGTGPEAKSESWKVVATDWKEFSGCQVPVKGDVLWELERGDFSYFKWEVTEVEYDRAELY